MTAEEARNITKAALVNYALLAKIDKEIEKAASQGKYQLTYNFADSYGYRKTISKEQYTTLCDRYEKVGFNVTRGLIQEENPSLHLSWYDEPRFETSLNNTETNFV